MKKILTKMKAVSIVLLAVAMLVGLVGSSTAVAADKGNEPWSFGVISDTQWTVADDGYNPNTVAANIIKQVDQEFIKHGVKLVVAVGDTVNEGDKANIDTRALYTQDLYNAGIGFYPFRGNHEATEGSDYLLSGPELRYAFPQIGTGVNNETPSAITTALIPTADLANNPPADRKGLPFAVGSDFSEPAAINTSNNGVSYSFRYNNATFMLLDQFNVNGEYYPSTIPQQQQWIDETLSSRPENSQAFVFVHKNILGGNHKDNMFGGPVAGDPGDGYGVNVAALSAADQAALAAKQEAENEFLASMQASKVPYVISGHDHHHYLSVVTSPDGQSKTHQLITQSDSSKFYTPKTPASANDVPVQQDLGRVGYYIFSVDGPRVTVDYYGDATGGSNYGPNGGTFNFVKMSSFSYSLNGKGEVVDQGASYAMTDDTTAAARMEKGFKGTSMSILSGTNSSTVKTNYGKAISNEVNTAWSAKEPGLASDVLSLSGMSKLPGEQTDVHALSLSYGPSISVNSDLIQNGDFGLLTRDASGNWVKAVTKNHAGTAKYVAGPYDPSYEVGTYGIDASTNTAWAVLDYDGDFAVGQLHP